jgi:hypothetical protein
VKEELLDQLISDAVEYGRLEQKHDDIRSRMRWFATNVFRTKQALLVDPKKVN